MKMSMFHLLLTLLASVLWNGMASAIEGTVIVLHTPLFAKPNQNSTILQYAKKGDVIWIRNSNVSPDPSKKNYDANNPEEGSEEYPAYHKSPDSGFYETVSRNGQSAFIKSEHLKIIYKDERESFTEIAPFKHDPTDYRLEEPLPSRYPIFDPERYRFSLAYAFGPQRKINYPYPSAITGENFDTRRGIYGHYTRKVEWDPYDRFYFGIFGYFFNSHSNFSLKSGASANESHTMVSTGPFFSYDTFRTQKVVLSFAGGITFNYHIATIIAQQGSTRDERKFSSINLSPRLGSNIQVKNVLPMTDFITGVELQMFHPYTLGPDSGPQQNSFWNNSNDQVSIEASAQFSIYLGFQANYN